ncbi:MAG: tetratricopeptide repeat protein [Planctomycetota bacterium]
MRNSSLILLVTLFIALVDTGQRLSAQEEQLQDGPLPDMVTVVGREPGRTVRYRGEITDWRGSRITIFTNGRSRTFDNNELISVRTTWPAAYNEAETLIAAGQFNTASQKLQEALDSESRRWAQVAIRAKMVQTLMATENHSEALTLFGSILAEDPDTRFIHLAPLPWTGSASVAQGLASNAEKWIDTAQPVVQLIGASWLLSGPKRQLAEQRLEQLANSGDDKVAALATAQLWRTVLPTANEQRVERWSQQLSQMPEDVRAGAYLILGTARGQVNQVDDAVVDLMRIPILFPDQPDLCAAALYKSAELLQNAGRHDEANALIRELKGSYAETSRAGQIEIVSAQDGN